jgi:hypothetical protein
VVGCSDASSVAATPPSSFPLVNFSLWVTVKAVCGNRYRSDRRAVRGRLASARNAAMRSVLRILLADDCDALGRFSCLGGFREDDGEHAVLE